MRAPVLFVVLLALLLTTPQSEAQFPTSMNYQVMLTDDLDEPLAEQTVNLVFRIYMQESGGTPIWTEAQSATTNSIGVVSVELGSVDPLPVDTWPGLTWLEVEVGGEILSPRRKLTSSPYAFEAMNSRRLGGLSMVDYSTDEELSTPGTINNSQNPVDWTKLKNVPPGFADGTDEAGGSGDGHSLDASDGNPTDAVWVAPEGFVGIGTTDPVYRLHVHTDSLASTRLALTNGASGSGWLDGLILYSSYVTGSGGVRNYEGPLYLSGGDGSAGLGVDAGVLSVAPFTGQSGGIEVYGADTDAYPLHRSYEDAHGGQFELKDEAGNVALLYGADDSGTGGRLLVQRDDTFSYDEGIDLNGQWGTSGEPALRILGSSRSTRFYMHNEGNDSVQLPQDAIYDYEILDEPGVASATSNSGVILLDGVWPIISQSIVAPSSGYVLAIATCQAGVSHTNGFDSWVDFGVSDSETVFPANQDVDVYIPFGASSGTYHFPVTVTGLFQVGSAGTYTYYMLGRRNAGESTIYDIQLSLVFLPTAYGTVEPTVARRAGDGRDEVAGTRSPVTEAEVAAQRGESEAANLARIERELAELQAQVEAMKEER